MNLIDALVAPAFQHARRLWLRPRFARLGTGSVVAWPIDVLTRPDRISIEENVFIRSHVRLEAVRAIPEAEPGTISIGNRAHLEGYCSISSASSIKIGTNVLFGANVSIRDHDHGSSMKDVHPIDLPLKFAAVSVGDYSWLGQNVVVLKGVHIGAHAVIGANSVVTRSVPEGAVMAGAPARQLGWVDGKVPDVPATGNS